MAVITSLRIRRADVVLRCARRRSLPLFYIRWIRFTVSNTGSMISAEHIRNIFDKYTEYHRIMHMTLFI